MSATDEVVKVLVAWTEDGVPCRRVRMADGSERVQKAKIEIETTITRADGSVEAGGEITEIRTGGVQ